MLGLSEVQNFIQNSLKCKIYKFEFVLYHTREFQALEAAFLDYLARHWFIEHGYKYQAMLLLIAHGLQVRRLCSAQFMHSLCQLDVSRDMMIEELFGKLLLLQDGTAEWKKHSSLLIKKECASCFYFFF